MQKAFIDAGLDKDIFQVFHCGDFTKVEKLVQAPEINLVCFTGSVPGGLAVQKAAAGRVDCKVGLELGGKDPCIVTATADLERAATAVLRGAVYATGQVCYSVERVYVHESVHDAFVEKLVAKAEAVRPSHPYSLPLLGAAVCQNELEVKCENDGWS